MKRQILLVGVVVALLASSASAETYLVKPDGSGDFPTIQAAIDAAGSGDTIELADGTFSGAGNRDIDYLGKAITIRSLSGNRQSCIIDCEGDPGDPHQGFRFHSGEGPGAFLIGVTIVNGYTAPGIGHGGGILVEGGSTPTVVDCVIQECYASVGGGIACRSASPTFRDCSFIDNQAGTGGGAECDDSSATFDRCYFIGNDSMAGGGLLATQSAPTLTGCGFYDNETPNTGGGILSSGGSMTIVNCTFSFNSAFEGAGIYSLQSQVYLEKSIVAHSMRGEGIACAGGGTVTLGCCDVYGNHDGDWVGCVADQYGVDGNFAADPLFCRMIVDRPLMIHSGLSVFSLMTTSPCMPGNHPDGYDCGLIGAEGIGCAPPIPPGGRWTAAKNSIMGTKPISWGEVKARFR